MAIGWLITLGYTSGYGTSLSRTEAEGKFYDLALETAGHVVDIAREAVHSGPNVPLMDEDGLTLHDYALHMAKFQDGSLRLETVSGSDGRIVETSVFMMASGGDKSRQMKEAVRRAYLRLLMEAMHFHGLDIQVSVA